MLDIKAKDRTEKPTQVLGENRLVGQDFDSPVHKLRAEVLLLGPFLELLLRHEEGLWFDHAATPSFSGFQSYVTATGARAQPSGHQGSCHADVTGLLPFMTSWRSKMRNFFDHQLTEKPTS